MIVVEASKQVAAAEPQRRLGAGRTRNLRRLRRGVAVPTRSLSEVLRSLDSGFISNGLAAAPFFCYIREQGFSFVEFEPKGH